MMHTSYEERLKAIALADENVIVMTAENRAAIRNLPASLGARFVDTGICEQTMIGAAAGLALRGRTPVVHALATFLTLRAFEFIRTDVGIAGLPVKLIGGVPGVLSEANGPTHQALEDIALMRGIPGMQIFCPADEQELIDALPAILASRAPAYVRFNASKPAITHQSDFQIGKAEVIALGADVIVLTYGFLFKEAVAACEVLRQQGVSAGLINLRTLRPVDEAVILQAARSTRLLVTLEDHFLTGGLYSIVAELLVKHRLSCDVMPIAFEDRWFKPALLDDVLQHEGLTGEQIALRISTALDGHRER
jgi:transketolase